LATSAVHCSCWHVLDGSGVHVFILPTAEVNCGAECAALRSTVFRRYFATITAERMSTASRSPLIGHSRHCWLSAARRQDIGSLLTRYSLLICQQIHIHDINALTSCLFIPQIGYRIPPKIRLDLVEPKIAPFHLPILETIRHSNFQNRTIATLGHVRLAISRPSTEIAYSYHFAGIDRRPSYLVYNVAKNQEPMT